MCCKYCYENSTNKHSVKAIKNVGCYCLGHCSAILRYGKGKAQVAFKAEGLTIFLTLIVVMV
jgi:hypothetical protein